MLIENALTEGHWSAKVGDEWNGSAFVAGGTAQDTLNNNGSKLLVLCCREFLTKFTLRQ